MPQRWCVALVPSLRPGGMCRGVWMGAGVSSGGALDGAQVPQTRAATDCAAVLAPSCCGSGPHVALARYKLKPACRPTWCGRRSWGWLLAAPGSLKPWPAARAHKTSKRGRSAVDSAHNAPTGLPQSAITVQEESTGCTCDAGQWNGEQQSAGAPCTCSKNPTAEHLASHTGSMDGIPTGSMEASMQQCNAPPFHTCMLPQLRLTPAAPDAFTGRWIVSA